MKTSKFLRRFAALFLALLLLLPYSALAAQESETVHITSAADLIAFQKNCTLDTWSAGKTVVLDKDISLENVPFIPIAYFAGTFDGNGHTISGLLITGAYSPAGLFAEVAASGVVENLTVNGTVQPAGEKTPAGGIAGVNNGTIEGCTFQGTVTAESEVGGIAGENTATGTIESSTATGTETGISMTGGIAGSNLGTVKACTNESMVNTQTEDPSINLSELELNSVSDLLSLASPDTYQISTDSGGIAGYNSGYLLSCKNNGTVGYEHVGYNVGGIAGRSCGFVSGCENSGTVYGRKEVGGIAGLAEPYVVRTLGSGEISDLQTELHDLSDMLDATITDAETSSSTLSGDLTRIGEQVDTVEDSANDLAQNAEAYADSVTGEVNRIGQVLDSTADQLAEVTDTLPAAADDLTKALDYTKQAAAQAEKAGASATNALNDLQSASKDLQQAIDLLNRAVKSLESGISALKTAAGSGTVTKASLQTALTDIENGISILTNGDTQSGNKGVSALLTSANTSLNNALDDAGTASDELSKAAEPIKNAVSSLAAASSEASEAVRDLDSLADYLSSVDPVSFATPSAYFGTSTESLYSGVQSVSTGLETLSGDLSGASEQLLEDFRQINEQISIISDLLLSELGELQSVSASDILEDTSGEDINAVTLGKLLRCENSGTVNGDIDVGGVAGSMSVYNEIDPEGDLSSGVSVSNRRYELKCILQSCESSGTVVAKKNAAGGIVGATSLGLLVSCEASGSVSSQSGDYVGGIVGSCGNAVKDCYAKTSLAGGSFVGGIFGGDADDALLTDISVQNCVSMVEITDATEFTGAIAGKSEGNLSGNVFVSDTLAGCNGLSRAGIAEPLAYSELLKLENLPAMFKSLTVRFVANDEVIKEVSCAYGESLDASVFPEIPAVDGSYGTWDTKNLSNLLFDKTVTAVYKTYVTALQSSAVRSNDHPVFFVAGDFDGSAKLEAEPAEVPFTERPNSLKDLFLSYNRQILEQWQLTFPADGSESHEVRYLLPDVETHHILIYLQTDDGWQELPYETVGSYLSFTVPQSQATITVLSSVTAWWVWAVLGAIVAAILVLILVTMIRTRLRVLRAMRAKSKDLKNVILQAHRTRLKIIFPLVLLLALLGATMAGILIFAPKVQQAEQNGESLFSVVTETVESFENEAE